MMTDKITDIKIKKLVDGIYQSLQKKYINFPANLQEIHAIVLRDPPAKITTDSVSRIMNQVIKYYEKKTMVLPPETSATNIKKIQPVNKEIETQSHAVALPPPPTDKVFYPPYEAKELLKGDVETWEYYVVVDSKDRDYVRFPDPNDYVIDCSPPNFSSSDERKGYIRRGFNNVVSVEVMSCMFLDTSDQSDASDYMTPPAYVIVDIPELKANIIGTNDDLTGSFHILTTFKGQGTYKYFDVPLNNSVSPMVVYYDGRISVNKLTIRYRLPSGDLYSFGETNNTNTNTVNNLVLRIKCMKHRYVSSFLQKENS